MRLTEMNRRLSSCWHHDQIEAKSGLGAAGQTQDAKSNPAALTDPTDIWSSINGLRVQELGWQQSLRDGEVVVVAGTISSATIPTATPPPTRGAAMLEMHQGGRRIAPFNDRPA